ncbi:CBS domain-containing protein [Pyrofollis japonicus]|nr:CBS domain-containing protein [Pyrofollis japonicus]
MFATRGIGHAAVVDENNILVGILSVKDIAKYVVEAFENAGTVEQATMEAVLDTAVAEISTKPPIVIREPDLCKAAELIVTRNIGFVPLVDDNGKFLGGYAELDTAFELLDSEKPARRYATNNVVVGEPEQPLIEALGFMLEQGFRRMPFKYDEDYYISTMSSLLRAIVRKPRAETLLRPVAEYASPAAVLNYDEARVSDVAEIILAITERAVLLLEDHDLKAIMTERDLVRAYMDEKECSRMKY